MRDQRDPQEIGEAILNLSNTYKVPILLAADFVLSFPATPRGTPTPATGERPESVRSTEVSGPPSGLPISTVGPETAAQNGAQAHPEAPEAEED